MQLRIINSNSMGNAYILESSTGERLLIECGVQIDKIKQALGFKLSNIAGCLLTHEHGDHAKSVNDIIKLGINVFASSGTHQALGTSNSHRAKVCRSEVPFTAGSFKVMPFDVKHDVKEPLGFLISHPECGAVLFLTDSYYCEYDFSSIVFHHIIIEANYCQTILDGRVAAGSNPKFLRDRVFTSHMSIETCKKTLATYNLTEVKNIVLIHLSDGNSDEARFKKEVQEQTGKQVFVARPGLTIPFNKTAF